MSLTPGYPAQKVWFPWLRGTHRTFWPPPLCVEDLAHRNRSDFCDLRLRCPSRTPEIARFPTQEKTMLHCDLRVRWKVASDLRFRAAISEPKSPSFCGISGDLAQSTRRSLAIAIVRFWCAKVEDPHPTGILAPHNKTNKNCSLPIEHSFQTTTCLQNVFGHCQSGHYPVLLFLGLFENTKANPPKHQGLF